VTKRRIDHDLAACGIYSPEISSLECDFPVCTACAGGVSGSSPVCVVALERKRCHNVRCERVRFVTTTKIGPVHGLVDVDG
jgi:hypothetical protein